MLFQRLVFFFRSRKCPTSCPVSSAHRCSWYVGHGRKISYEMVAGPHNRCCTIFQLIVSCVSRLFSIRSLHHCSVLGPSLSHGLGSWHTGLTIWKRCGGVGCDVLVKFGLLSGCMWMSLKASGLRSRLHRTYAWRSVWLGRSDVAATFCELLAVLIRHVLEPWA